MLNNQRSFQYIKTAFESHVLLAYNLFQMLWHVRACRSAKLLKSYNTDVQEKKTLEKKMAALEELAQPIEHLSGLLQKP